MKSLAEYNPGVAAPELKPPAWLPAHLCKFWISRAPEKLSVAGDYTEPELWMLINHVADMERGRSEFCISPMGEKGGVGTYRLGMK